MDAPELWIALRDVPDLGRRGACELLERFGSPSGVFSAPPRALDALCRGRLRRALARGPALEPARAELRLVERLGMRALGRDAPGFPEPLLHIPDPPLLLYLRGELPRAPRVAIVGSRRPSPRARETARALAAAAARAGACVVSGLAYGVDAVAHQAALEAGGGTLAVLASGLDRAGPAGNRALARRILAAGGGWLSEHPPGTAALAHHFPVRNRLISGLSRLVLVVEARERSGSLWTASHAADQSRDVAAVPGPVDSDQCRGSNRLLRDGALVILDPGDLLQALELPGGAEGSAERCRAGRACSPGADTGGPRPGPQDAGGGGTRMRPAGARAEAGGAASPRRGPLDPSRLLAALADGPCELDALGRTTGLEPADLAALLLELELAGQVTRRGSLVLRRS